MRDFKGTTQSEDKMFKAFQKANGSYPNGIVGTQTMTEAAIRLGADCFPLTVEMYSLPVIVGHDIIPFHASKSVKNYTNSAVGSFTSPRATTPCSILVTAGKIIWNEASRAWAGYPEAVMYKCNGKVKMGLFKFATDLPKGTEWAVGGMGLGAYWNPDGQGFKKIKMPDGSISDYYSTVAYRTDHIVLGYKLGMMWLVYYKNKTAKEIDTHMNKYFMFDFALKGDGGGLAAMNGAEDFAKKNTSTKQGYIIQMV